MQRVVLDIGKFYDSFAWIIFKLTRSISPCGGRQVHGRKGHCSHGEKGPGPTIRRYLALYRWKELWKLRDPRNKTLYLFLHRSFGFPSIQNCLNFDSLNKSIVQLYFRGTLFFQKKSENRSAFCEIETSSYPLRCSPRRTRNIWRMIFILYAFCFLYHHNFFPRGFFSGERQSKGSCSGITCYSSNCVQFCMN